ncbi:MAG: hypothetical protein ACRC2T_04595, partial [Thermoguttaceae bacterium]
HCFKENPKERPNSMAEVADRLVEIYEEVSGSPFPKTKPSSTSWNAESINNRAASLLDLNKPKEADNYFRQALQMQPWQPEAMYNQILQNWRAANITDNNAVSQIESLVKIRGNAQSHYALGLIQRERGNIPPAVIAFENACEIEPRPEFSRALDSAKKLASKSVSYLERFSIERLALSNGVFPGVLLDDKEEFIIVAVDKTNFVVSDTKTGRKILGLRRSDSAYNGSGNAEQTQIAISEDFKWELLTDSSGDKFFLVKSDESEEKVQKTVFRLVEWGRQQKNHDWILGSGLENDKNSITIKREISLTADNNTVKISDRRSGEVLSQLLGHEAQVTAVDVGGRSGDWIATGGNDETIRIWELVTGRCVRTIANVNSSIEAIYISKSGAFLLALLGDNSLRMWNVSLLCRSFKHLRAPIMLCLVSSSEELSRQQNEMANSFKTFTSLIESGEISKALTFLESMRKLSGWEIVKKEIPWDFLARKCVRLAPVDSICSQTFTGHEDAVSAVAISFDGRFGVSTGRDRTIRIWNLNSGKIIRVIEGHLDWIRDIAITLDGKYILSGSWDTTVKIWSTSNGKCLRSLNENIRSISKVAFHPLGKLAAIATSSGSVLLWNVVSDTVVGVWNAHQGGINSISFSRDGKYIITSADDAAVKFWDAKTQRLLNTTQCGKLPITASTTFFGYGSLITATKGGIIEIHDIRNIGAGADAKEQQLKPRQVSAHLAEITSVDVSADNRFIISSSRDGTVKIWSVESGKLLRTLSGHSNAITGISADFLSAKILTGSEDGTVSLWDIFWDFAYPNEHGWDKNAEPVLWSLLSLYCDENAPQKAPNLDKQGFDRIIMELGFRGFGWINKEVVIREIDRFIRNWPGSQLTGRTVR